MKNLIQILFIISVCSIGFGQKANDNRIYNLLEKKNFDLIYQIHQNQEVIDLLNDNEELIAFNQIKEKEIQSSLKTIGDNKSVINAYKLSQNEINITDKVLKNLSNNRNLKKIIQNLRDNGSYAIYNDLNDLEFISKSWKLCANGINHVLNVYGLGQKPMYPTIDSASYDKDSEFYQYSVYSWGELIANKRIQQKNIPFDYSIDMALSMLYMNHRDEAIRYDPLFDYNQKANEFAKSIQWNQYPYSAIIVLGSGPENYMDRLTSLGKLNLQLGVIEFLKGNAPFIIVSGGHVHPYRSEYAEAIEMKKELIEVYGIAEKHILIDPYARHTTTNLRNATRLLIEAGVSLKRPTLVVTNINHSDYTYGKGYLERSVKELQYEVGRFGKRLSSTTIEFFPSTFNTTQNPLEPLDP